MPGVAPSPGPPLPVYTCGSSLGHVNVCDPPLTYFAISDRRILGKIESIVSIRIVEKGERYARR